MIEDSNTIYKKNMVWNAIAGLINAAEAIVVLAVVSRVNGLKEAGILTISFSLANLFMTIGKFGMRCYQVAHDGEDYSFKTFFISRIITVITMVLIAFIYNIYCFLRLQYTIEKSMVIFFVCMWYAVEALEDVFAGKYQAIGRLDVGSKIFSIRWCITIGVFVVSDFVSKDIVISVVCAFGVCFLTGIVLIMHSYAKYMKKENLRVDKGLHVLFRESTALCVAAFLYFYMTNIPKYAINSFLGDEVQAIYGYISMPVFVISLLNSFIYQPQLTAYIIEWKESKLKQFTERIVRQLLAILLIMLICFWGAYLLGIPVLSILYHEDLSAYKIHFLLLMVGGGFLAVGAYMENMLVIINEQKKGMIGYLIASVIGYILVKAFVKKFQLLGAIWGYTITMFLIALIFSIMLIFVIRKKGREVNLSYEQ